jgi:hypothetical protein
VVARIRLEQAVHTPCTMAGGSLCVPVHVYRCSYVVRARIPTGYRYASLVHVYCVHVYHAMLIWYAAEHIRLRLTLVQTCTARRTYIHVALFTVRAKAPLRRATANAACCWYVCRRLAAVLGNPPPLPPSSLSLYVSVPALLQVTRSTPQAFGGAFIHAYRTSLQRSTAPVRLR